MGFTKWRDNNACSYFDPSNLNNYFTKIALTNSECSTIELNKILSLPCKPFSATFSFLQVTPYQIKFLLTKSINSSNDISSDNLPIHYISNFIDTLTPYITDIYNLAIYSNKYPNSWKFAQVILLLNISKPSQFLTYLI